MKSLQRKVILYGDSLILEGIHTNLRDCPDLEMVSLVPPLPKAHRLDQLSPDVIIFDLEAHHIEAMLELLQTRPQLLLIGIDLMTNQMLLWSGEHSRALRLQDLVKAIRDLPGVNAHATQPAGNLSRGWSQFAAPFHFLKGASRQQKLAWGAFGLVLCAVLAVGLMLSHPVADLPLVGAAIGQPEVPGYVFTFTAGLIIGCLAFGLFLRRRR